MHQRCGFQALYERSLEICEEYGIGRNIPSMAAPGQQQTLLVSTRGEFRPSNAALNFEPMKPEWARHAAS